MRKAIPVMISRAGEAMMASPAKTSAQSLKALLEVRIMALLLS